MRIAMISKGRINPAHESARDAAEAAARETGALLSHYIPRRADDAHEQQVLLREAIDTCPDALLIAPIEAPGLADVLRAAGDRGIALAYFISMPATSPPHHCFVGADDVVVGALITQAVVKRVVQGDVLIVTGYGSAPTSRDRLLGARRVLTETPGIHLKAVLDGGYQRHAAYEAVLHWLARDPRLDGIVVFNDVMALGALDACRELGLRCCITGVNAIPEARQAIMNGTLLASASFDPALMAREAVLQLVRLGAHVAPPCLKIHLPIRLITQESLMAAASSGIGA